MLVGQKRFHHFFMSIMNFIKRPLTFSANSATVYIDGHITILRRFISR